MSYLVVKPVALLYSLSGWLLRKSSEPCVPLVAIAATPPSISCATIPPPTTLVLPMDSDSPNGFLLHLWPVALREGGRSKV
uniref:Putative secreted protein n=1 Tax=Anopheles marajoara TaxID=58244 RepID=A0A2M4CC15_9DIPT